MTLLALTLTVLTAVAVFLIMQFRRADEQQAAAQRIALLTGETETSKKKLAGFTRALDALPTAKKALTDQAATYSFKLTREYLHVEAISKDRYKLKADVKAYVQYTVEYAVGIDPKSARFDLEAAALGVLIKASAPTLTASPVVRGITPHFTPPGIVADERPIMADLNPKLTQQAQRMAANLPREDWVKAFCRVRMTDVVRDHLANQQGVQHLPYVGVEFV